MGSTWFMLSFAPIFIFHKKHSTGTRSGIVYFILTNSMLRADVHVAHLHHKFITW